MKTWSTLLYAAAVLACSGLAQAAAAQTAFVPPVGTLPTGTIPQYNPDGTITLIPSVNPGDCTLSIFERPVNATSWEMWAEITSLTTGAIMWSGPEDVYVNNADPSCILAWQAAMTQGTAEEQNGKICGSYVNIGENGPCT